MQCWGRATTSGATGTVTITLPAEFADTNYYIQLTPSYYGSNYTTFECSAQRSSKNKINIYTRKSDGSLLGGVDVYYFVCGKWK